jgi:uncharacterized protein (DUF1919 family)
MVIENTNIVSNSCVGSGVYKEIHVEYFTPLVGSLFMDDYMYLKFLENYDYYCNLPVKTEMIKKNVHFSKHNSISDNYVLMKLNQIEIHWIHEDSEDVVLEKWNRRLKKSLNKKKVYVWSSPELKKCYSKEERQEIIKRFCNLNEFTIFLTEIKEEETVTNNYIIKYVSEWEGKLQKDRTSNGDATIWNDQPLTTRILVDLIKTIV